MSKARSIIERCKKIGEASTSTISPSSANVADQIKSMLTDPAKVDDLMQVARMMTSNTSDQMAKIKAGLKNPETDTSKFIDMVKVLDKTNTVKPVAANVQ